MSNWNATFTFKYKLIDLVSKYYIGLLQEISQWPLATSASASERQPSNSTKALNNWKKRVFRNVFSQKRSYERACKAFNATTTTTTPNVIPLTQDLEVFEQPYLVSITTYKETDSNRLTQNFFRKTFWS